MWETIITALASVVVVIIEVRGRLREKRIEAERKEENKKTAIRAQQRAEESLLSMDLMNANCALAVVTAKKVTNRQTNGDVEEAMRAAAVARERYDNFCKRLTARQVAKTE